METTIEIIEEKKQHSYTEKEKQTYSVEEVFDRIDTKFIDYYGEYGRKLVNDRRTEWNQDHLYNFKML